MGFLASPANVECSFVIIILFCVLFFFMSNDAYYHQQTAYAYPHRWSSQHLLLKYTHFSFHHRSQYTGFVGSLSRSIFYYGTYLYSIHLKIILPFSKSPFLFVLIYIFFVVYAGAVRAYAFDETHVPKCNIFISIDSIQTVLYISRDCTEISFSNGRLFILKTFFRKKVSGDF